MKTKKHNKKHVARKGFVRRNYDLGKQIVIKHTATGLISIIISSVIPMLEQWHSDKIQSDAMSDLQSGNRIMVRDVKTDLQKEMDDFRTDQISKNKAMWQAINSKQDKAVWQTINSANTLNKSPLK